MSTAILARLLTPDDYGLIAMVMSIAVFALIIIFIILVVSFRMWVAPFFAIELVFVLCIGIQWVQPEKLVSNPDEPRFVALIHKLIYQISFD